MSVCLHTGLLVFVKAFVVKFHPKMNDAEGCSESETFKLIEVKTCLAVKQGVLILSGEG